MKTNFFTVLVICCAILFGCGKKDEAPTTENKPSQTTTTNTDTKKNEPTKIKKSEEPKKKESPEAPSGWIDITSPDGKLTFKIPEGWEAESSKDGAVESFTATSSDGTMGLVAIAFGNKDVTADMLLDAQIEAFDFEPEGEAYAVETDNIDGWVVAASGNVKGSDMMMYMLSFIDKNSEGNYLVYIFSSPEDFNSNSGDLETILYSVDVKN